VCQSSVQLYWSVVLALLLCGALSAAPAPQTAAAMHNSIHASNHCASATASGIASNLSYAIAIIMTSVYVCCCTVRPCCIVTTVLQCASNLECRTLCVRVSCYNGRTCSWRCCSMSSSRLRCFALRATCTFHGTLRLAILFPATGGFAVAVAVAAAASASLHAHTRYVGALRYLVVCHMQKPCARQCSSC
jgi:hypothetical protein